MPNNKVKLSLSKKLMAKKRNGPILIAKKLKLKHKKVAIIKSKKVKALGKKATRKPKGLKKSKKGKSAKKSKKLKKQTKKKAPAALIKVMNVSDNLAAIIGQKKASRPQCIKALWAYLKKHNLQDAEHRQFFRVDIVTIPTEPKAG